MRERIKNFFYIFVFLFFLWLALTFPLKKEEIVLGGFISFVLALFLNKLYLNLGLPFLSFRRIYFFFIYLIVLSKEIAKANLDVAYRVIHPRMPIKPGIVVIKTNLKQDIAKLILANSITLTPGTLTLDIKEDKLLIHWIDVKAEDKDEATKIVGERFEKYLKVIFG